MLNIYEQLNNKGYLLLDQEVIDIGSIEKLTRYFEGYNKTISTLMMAYFGLPMWPTLILFNPTLQSVHNAITDFSQSSNDFFVRSDTQFNKIDNLNFRDCPSEKLLEDILKIKEYKDRWVIILAVPSEVGQEFRNNANCRMGRINGVYTQEWTGTGFSEYHLGKDKFPHKAALHSVMQLDNTGKINKVFQISKENYLKDLEQLFLAYGCEKLKLKRKFIDKNYFKDLLGRDYIGKEPTNEEMELAFATWLERESISRSDLIEQGISYVNQSGIVCNSTLNYLNKKSPWKPSKTQIDFLISKFTLFEERCKEIGLASEGKILTCSFNDSNKAYNKYGVVFWDIFNLFN